MEEDLLNQMTATQLTSSLTKAQEELEGLLKLPAPTRTTAQKSRMLALIGTAEKPGWIKSLKSRLETQQAAEAEEASAVEANRSLKAWLGSPAAPATHSGQGGTPPGVTPVTVETVRPRIKSFGQLVVESDQFKRQYQSIGAGGTVSITLKSTDIDRIVPGGLKTLMTTTAGYQPNRMRLGLDKDVEYAVRPPRVRDLISLQSNAPYRISWMEQTTRTNNAAARAEGVAAGENAYVWTERTADSVTIPVTIPVTEQQLKTTPQIETLISRMLTEDVTKVEEDYILSGNAGATPPQLPGILNHASILTIGVGADAREVKLTKAITKIGTQPGRYRQATAILLHPNDMEAMRLAKDTTGQYLLAHPLIDTTFNWVVPIIPTTAITEGIALVGDFERGVEIHRVDEVGVEFGYSADDFGKLRRTARCWIIESMSIYMPDAFCSVNFAAA